MRKPNPITSLRIDEAKNETEETAGVEVKRGTIIARQRVLEERKIETEIVTVTGIGTGTMTETESARDANERKNWSDKKRSNDRKNWSDKKRSSGKKNSNGNRKSRDKKVTKTTTLYFRVLGAN